MIFEQKYFSSYILLIDLLSLPEYLFAWISGNTSIVIAFYPVCDVIKFQIYLSFLIKLFSYMTKKVKKKSIYLKNEKSFLNKIKSIIYHF